MIKRCLFIDDNPEDVESVLEDLKDLGHSRGLEISSDLFGLDTNAGCYDSDSNLDKDKIKNKLTDCYLTQNTYDLVVCDFDLEDEVVNGLQVARMVREKNRNCIIALYSGNLEKVADDIAKIGNQKERKKKVKDLFNTKVSQFIDRSSDFHNQLIHTLEHEIPVEVTIARKLREHGDLEFKHGYQKFVGRTLGHVADEIENHKRHGNIFKEEIIERGIAHMIELNR